MNNYAEFLSQFLPLAAAHLLLPPLSFFSGERIEAEIADEIFCWLYSVVPPSLLNRKFVESLLFDSSHGTDFHYTMISHLFVHSSYEHLFHNLSAAMQFAYPVYNEFGSAGLYFLFLSGGAIASLPIFFRSDQNSAFSKLVYDSISIKPGNGIYSQYVPGGLLEFWNKTGALNIATTLTGVIPTKVCGSSGAVFALMGCDVAILFRDCFSTIVNAFQSNDVGDYHYYTKNRKSFDSNGDQNNISGKTFLNNFNEMNQFIYRKMKKIIQTSAKSDAKTILRLFNLYRGINICCQELNIIYPIKSENFKFYDKNLLSKASDLFYIGHAEHVQGFFYGVSFACMFGVIYPMLLDRRRNVMR